MPGLRPHDLQCSAARNLVRAGVSEGVVMKLCGWTTRHNQEVDGSIPFSSNILREALHVTSNTNEDRKDVAQSRSIRRSRGLEGRESKLAMADGKELCFLPQFKEFS